MNSLNPGYYEPDSQNPPADNFDMPFAASLTVLTTVNGDNYYDWVEQYRDPSDGVFHDLPGGRTGSYSVNGTSPAQAMNNDVVGLPTYVELRFSSIVNGQTFYEFQVTPTDVFIRITDVPSTTFEDLAIPPDMTPLPSCWWRAEILKTDIENDCAALTTYGPTEPRPCLATDVRYYTGDSDNLPKGNPPLIRVGETYRATLAGMVADPDEPTSGKKVPLYFIASYEYRTANRLTVIDTNTSQLINYTPTDGFFVGATVRSAEFSATETNGLGTEPENLDIRYGFYQPDTGLFELLPVAKDLTSATLMRRMKINDRYLYEWVKNDYGSDYLITIGVTYGGVLPADAQLTHTQTADGAFPEIYQLVLVKSGTSALGGTFGLNDSGSGNVNFPAGSSHSTVQAGLTNFGVTGSGTKVDPYVLTGSDALAHSLTVSNGLTPNKTNNPATFDNQDVGMCTPVKTKLWPARSSPDVTVGPQDFMLVLWSNGSECCAPLAGVDLSTLSTYTPAPMASVAIVPTTGDNYLITILGDSGSWAITVDGGSPIFTLLGVTPSIPGYTITTNADGSLNLTSTSGPHTLVGYAGGLRTKVPRQVVIWQDGCAKLAPEGC